MPVTALPFELRPLARLGLPDWSVGALCASFSLLICLGLLYASNEALVGRSATDGLRLTGQAHVAVLVCVLFGYLVGVALGFARVRLPPAGSTAGDARHGPGPESAASLLSGAAGLVTGALLIFFSTQAIRIQEPTRDVWGAGELAIDAVSLLLLWGLGRAVLFTLRGARPGQLDSPPIDLLNLAPLFPIARGGLRAALAWIGGISLGAAVMAFDPNPEVLVDAGWIIVTILCLSLAVGSVALLAPVWHLHERIGAAKEAALAATLQDLRMLRERGAARPGEEADLLARNAYYAGISTWPIDIGTLRRFGFYVFFPVASWLCGTVVQRLLDTVLVSELVRFLLELAR